MYNSDYITCHGGNKSQNLNLLELNRSGLELNVNDLRPSYSGSHQAPNHVQGSELLQSILKWFGVVVVIFSISYFILLNTK